MTKKKIKILMTLLCVFACNILVYGDPVMFYPVMFWEEGWAKGVMLVKPAEMLVIDLNGNKERKVIAKENVFIIYLSPDGKKLAYTTVSGIWLVKLETGETSLVASGYCDFFRWSPDSTSFIFSSGEYKEGSVPPVSNVNFFWADGEGKNIKQIYP